MMPDDRFSEILPLSLVHFQLHDGNHTSASSCLLQLHPRTPNRGDLI